MDGLVSECVGLEIARVVSVGTCGTKNGGSLPLSDPASLSNQARWFAVQVRPRAEKFVAGLLSYKGYEPFLPLYRMRHRWSDRSKEVELPLFSGYVFARLDPLAKAPIVSTPGVIRLVGNGRHAVPLEDNEINALQRISRAGICATPWPFVRVGQRVQVVAGPLRGTAGLILRLKDEWRLVVSVNLLQRSVVAEIDRNCVVPVNWPDAASSSS
jgi:transcriptional antiterminator NusG